MDKPEPCYMYTLSVNNVALLGATTALLLERGNCSPSANHLRSYMIRKIVAWLSHRYYKLHNWDWKRITWANSHNTRTRKQSLLEVFFWTIQIEKWVFHVLTYSLLFKLVEQFQKGAQLQRSVDLYSGVLVDVYFVGMQNISLFYNGRNPWIVDCWRSDELHGHLSRRFELYYTDVSVDAHHQLGM